MCPVLPSLEWTCFSLPLNMLTIFCCEDVDPVEMGPSGPIRCLTRRCSIAFLVMVTANVTALEGFGPKDSRLADQIKNLCHRIGIVDGDSNIGVGFRRRLV